MEFVETNKPGFMDKARKEIWEAAWYVSIVLVETAILSTSTSDHAGISPSITVQASAAAAGYMTQADLNLLDD